MSAEPGDVKRSDEIIHPDDINLTMLAALLDAAYIRFTVGDDELYVTESYRFWVSPRADGRRLLLYTLFSFNPNSDFDARLAYVNSINDGLVMIRASVSRTDLERLVLDFSVPVEGGITKRALVYAIRFFDDVIGSALKLDHNDLLK